ncbi:MAG: hypothetical protein ACNA8R_06040 [Nitriliruptoraceae bacterium]
MRQPVVHPSGAVWLDDQVPAQRNRYGIVRERLRHPDVVVGRPEPRIEPFLDTAGFRYVFVPVHGERVEDPLLQVRVGPQFLRTAERERWGAPGESTPEVVDGVGPG